MAIDPVAKSCVEIVIATGCANLKCKCRKAHVQMLYITNCNCNANGNYRNQEIEEMSLIFAKNTCYQ